MDRLLRLKNIIGNPKAEPPIPPIIPVSKKYMVGRRENRSLSPTGQTWAEDYGMAGGRHSRDD